LKNCSVSNAINPQPLLTRSARGVFTINLTISKICVEYALVKNFLLSGFLMFFIHKNS
jgi:hypothetical protein